MQQQAAINPKADVIGEICPVCKQEAFQLFDREARLSPGVSVIIRCCSRCRNRVDMENLEEQRNKSLDGLTKAERRVARQEMSQEWAQSFHGKRVLIHYCSWAGGSWLGYAIANSDTLPEKSQTEYTITGTAYHLTEYKWARLLFILDREQHHRVTRQCHNFGFCKLAGRDMHRSGIACPVPYCEKCAQSVLVLDNEQWGIQVRRRDDRYATEIPWSSSEAIELFDEI